MKDKLKFRMQPTASPQQKSIGMVNKNGVLVPRGTITKRIIIEADDKGMIYFDAFNIGALGQLSTMDTREMVLGLMKVCMDTSAVLFNEMRGGTSPDGKEGNDNKGI